MGEYGTSPSSACSLVGSCRRESKVGSRLPTSLVATLASVACQVTSVLATKAEV